MENKFFSCTVCKYPEIRHDPYEGMHDICPSCGIQFGYWDCGPEPVEFYWKVLRERWAKNGCPWESGCRVKPEWWNPKPEDYNV